MDGSSERIGWHTGTCNDSSYHSGDYARANAGPPHHGSRPEASSNWGLMSGLTAPRRGDAASESQIGHDGWVSPARASSLFSKAPLWMVGAVACLLAVGVYAASATGANHSKTTLPGAVIVGGQSHSGGATNTETSTSPGAHSSHSGGTSGSTGPSKKPSSNGSGTTTTGPSAPITSASTPTHVVSPNMPVVSSNDDGTTEMIVPTTNPEGENEGQGGSENGSGGGEHESGRSSGSTEN